VRGWKEKLSARVSDRHGADASRMNGFLLQDALFGFLIVSLLVLMFSSAVFVYRKSEVGVDHEIEIQWLYDD